MPKDRNPLAICQGINIGSDYDEEQRRFLYELNRHKQASGKSFMSELDAFRVAMAMGYRKDIPLPESDRN